MTKSHNSLVTQPEANSPPPQRTTLSNSRQYADTKTMLTHPNRKCVDVNVVEARNEREVKRKPYLSADKVEKREM